MLLVLLGIFGYLGIVLLITNVTKTNTLTPMRSNVPMPKVKPPKVKHQYVE